MAMKIKSGEIIFLNFFDVGGEVNLDEAEPFLEKFGELSGEYSGTYTKAWVEGGRLSLKVKVSDKIEFKVHPLGAITVRHRVKIENKDYKEIVDVIKKLDDEVKGDTKELSKKIIKAIDKAIYNRYPKVDASENYEIIYIGEAEYEGKIFKAPDILRHKEELVALLREERDLEDITEEDIKSSLELRHVFSRRDIIIVDWSAAVLFCSGTTCPNLLHMIELAKMQLLQLRVYDLLLDKMLKETNTFLTLAATPIKDHGLSKRISEISSIRIELVSMMKDLMNISKVAKDRLSIETYNIASKRFLLDHWSSTINSKFEQLDTIYKDIYEKTGTSTMVKLEWAIVILIVIEILISLYTYFVAGK